MLKVVIYDGEAIFITKKFKKYKDAYAFLAPFYGDYHVILIGKGK
jgi:hypothetical protein